MSSMEKLPLSQIFYLKMKPIEKNSSSNRFDKNLAKNFAFNVQCGKNSNLSLSKSHDQLFSNTLYENEHISYRKRAATTTKINYKCIDEYVKMIEPEFDSKFVNSNNMDFKSKNYSITSQIENRSKCGHSQSPDVPPPSVAVAEHVIYGLIRPNYNGTHASITQQDKTVEMRANSNETEDLEVLAGRGSFAGLLRGSTQTLNQFDDERKTIALRLQQRLRSPSLVKSITKTTNGTLKAPSEEFDELKIWREIIATLDAIIEENEKCDAENNNNNNTRISETSKNNSLKIRKPVDLLIDTRQLNNETGWCHSVNTLIYGQILFNVYYLGSTIITGVCGVESTRKSISKLKQKELAVDNDERKIRLKVDISLSCMGVKFMDVDKQTIICLHAIENINCVCQDADDLRYFAYITKEFDRHYCHVFVVDNTDLATDIILTLGQAFEVAFQLATTADNN